MTIVAPARWTRCDSPASRPMSAASRVTRTDGSFGTSPGPTRRSFPGRASTHRGSSSRGLGVAATTRVPRAARKFASPRVDPMASASGFTWHTRTTSSASPRTRAAWSNVVSGSILLLDLPQQLVHAFRPPGRVVLLEQQLGQELQAHLVSQDLAEVAGRRAQTGGRGPPLRLLAQHRVVHHRPPEVRRHVHAGDRDEPDPRILQ